MAAMSISTFWLERTILLCKAPELGRGGNRRIPVKQLVVFFVLAESLLN
jgi:hypothetical protein